MFGLFKKKVEIDAQCLAQAVLQTTEKLREHFRIAESLYEISSADIAEIIKINSEAQMMFLSFESRVFDFCLQDAYHDKYRTRTPEKLPKVNFSILPSLRIIWLELIDNPVASANLRMRYQYIFEQGLMNKNEQELWHLMENISGQSNLHFMYDMKLSLTWLDFIISLSKPNPTESMNILISNQA